MTGVRNGTWDEEARSPSFFPSRDSVFSLATEDVDELLEGKGTRSGVARFCLHDPAESNINVMALVQEPGTVSRFKAHKMRSKIYIHLRGTLYIDIADQDGATVSTIECSLQSQQVVFVPPGVFHRTRVGDVRSVFVEVLDGPYMSEKEDRTYLVI